MAQILLPTTDQATGSWSSTPLWSKVDDDSSVNPTGDGTIITSDDNSATDEADFALSTGTDPQVTTGHIIRARWNRSQAGGHGVRGELALWQGVPGTGTLIATLVSANPIETTEVEDTHTLSAGEAGSITDYTDLYLRLSRIGGNGGPPGNRESLIADLIELELPDPPASEPEVNVEEVTETDTPGELSPVTELVGALEEVTETDTPGELSPVTELRVDLEEVTTTLTAGEMVPTVELRVDLEEPTEIDTPGELAPVTELVGALEEVTETDTPGELSPVTELRVDLEEVTTTLTAGEMVPEPAAAEPEVNVEKVTTTLTAGEMVPTVELRVALEEVTETTTAADIDLTLELLLLLEEVTTTLTAGEMVLTVGDVAWFTPEPITLNPGAVTLTADPITYNPIT